MENKKKKLMANLRCLSKKSAEKNKMLEIIF